jgi:hypothetical protein
VPAGAERGASGAELRGRPQPPGLRKNSRIEKTARMNGGPKIPFYNGITIVTMRRARRMSIGGAARI